MAEDALEHLEQFAAHGGLLMAPEDMEALKSVLKELQARRSFCEIYRLYPSLRARLRDAFKEMEARTNPLSPPS